MTVRSGQLRDLITIQKFTRTDDGFGGFDEVYSDVRDVWARIKPVRAKEVFDHDKVQHIVNHEIEIRETDIADIDLSIDRIKFGTRFFKVVGSRDISERGFVRILDATEDKSSPIA